MADNLVVDANVIAKLYLRDEQYIDKADLLFDRFQKGNVDLIAPQVITYEVPAAIKKGAARVRASEETWKDAIESFESLGLVVVDDSDAKYDATRLAMNYSIGYYDALYMLLAEDLGCQLVTADDKLWRNLHGRVRYLVLLASYK